MRLSKIPTITFWINEEIDCQGKFQDQRRDHTAKHTIYNITWVNLGSLDKVNEITAPITARALGMAAPRVLYNGSNCVRLILRVFVLIHPLFTISVLYISRGDAEGL
jgi:hypothetical protein